MPKRSRSCSDLRGVSIIKSTGHKIPKRDSSAKLSLLKPDCIYVQNSPYRRLSTLDDFDIDDVDVSSYDIDRQIKKNETLSKLIQSLIIEKQSREKCQSSLKESRRSSSKFDNHTGASAKKLSIDQSSISSSSTRLSKEKPRPSNVTDDDMESMREIIRIDKGLPKTKPPKKKSIDLHKVPTILPRPTKLSESRYQCTRASHPRLKSLSSRDSCYEKSIHDYDKSPQEIWLEEDLDRLKYLAESHKSSAPPYKFNRVFHLRYQHNKGYPEIPDSFRQSYERYNKPLFHMVKKLNLPRKYLMPKFGENEISVLGLINEVPIRIFSREKEEEFVPKRKHIAKRGRVLRMIDIKPDYRTPWHYGRVKSCSPESK